MPEKPRPENLAKLTPEQRKVYDSWEAEREITRPLMEQALAAHMIGDTATAKICYEKLERAVPNFCEHGRSIWGGCEECSEIERILYPDALDKDSFCLGEEISPNKLLN